ncbi:hypothetical protein E3N88_22342 [Mikania micrantha]|uniref:Uncharacterized protein n=1 Tax=Mikania micrantha TaxID=192012 RepID=A0A5N6NA75_9ASTR|nr:hypothetical protein E3N88_22342 [Mikania micrantha]
MAGKDDSEAGLLFVVSAAVVCCWLSRERLARWLLVFFTLDANLLFSVVPTSWLKRKELDREVYENRRRDYGCFSRVCCKGDGVSCKH